MANKLDPMDIKQILVLIKDGYSNRKIGATLGISRNTVNNYVHQFNSSGYSISQLLSFDEIRLSELFTSKTTIDTSRHDDLMRYLERINAARSHPGFTFQYHYNDYVNNVSTPYSYTQFLEHFHRKYSKAQGSLKLEHIAGHEMFVDFAGKKLKIVDKSTGEIKSVEVFVSILPCSQYTYVEACATQGRNDFINCCKNALHFYGGVPKAIVSDNLKSAVTRASKHEPVINRSFKDFASHYSCVINPTRVYAPQDKALVENAVHLTYQRIYYPLREMTFFSIEELNREIRRLLTEYNKLLFTRKEASRLELFQTIERGYLKPLPCEQYEIKGYCRAKVQKMGYVYFSPDKNYYSVPYRYIGKHTQIHYTQKHIEVYYDHQRIAIHQRNHATGSYNTNADHLSSTHQAYLSWNPDYFKNKAAALGEHVVSCVEHILTSVDYPEIGYKRVIGLLQLHKAYGSDRLNRACKMALNAGMPSYMRIKNILKNNMDKALIIYDESDNALSHIPLHHNIRGASSYS
ncbi:MAG: IS21 family transposase [Bacteroidales bacterium]|jgi:predicted transcriptional regulator|nr:IS21 family transposase [Bacteroidales bacterium]MDY0370654.1 IS21 family transposase [Bacteroidales bacterium]